MGAIAAPYTSSLLIDAMGPAAMLWFMSGAHVALIVFGLIRMRARPAPTEERTPYIYAPRTSFQIGRLLRSLRETLDK